MDLPWDNRSPRVSRKYCIGHLNKSRVRSKGFSSLRLAEDLPGMDEIECKPAVVL